MLLQNNKTTAQPSRSQSAHVVAGYDRTVWLVLKLYIFLIFIVSSVDDPSKTNGFRLNDRCMWTEGNRAHKATIRFLGHLKGHSNLYAGLEFVSFSIPFHFFFSIQFHFYDYFYCFRTMLLEKEQECSKEKLFSQAQKIAPDLC